MSSSRITWVDLMKTFSILSVVLYHTPCAYTIKTFAYILCLPAFFFASSIFANAEMSPKNYFYRKTLRLLVPYIIFGLLSWAAWLIVARKYGNETESVTWWRPLVGMVYGNVSLLYHNRPLWFLCCLISLEWLYFILYLIPQRKFRILGALFIGAIGCLLSYYRKNGFWEITAAMLILPIYSICSETQYYIKTQVIQWKTLYIFLLLLFSFIGVLLGYYLNPQFHISTGIVGNPLIFYLTIISVIGLWSSFSILIARYSRSLQWLSYIGQNTLLILCAHIPVFGMIKGIALLCHVSLDFFETVPGCLCLWLGTFVILLPASFFVNKYCPWILGKQKVTL